MHIASAPHFARSRSLRAEPAARYRYRQEQYLMHQSSCVTARAIQAVPLSNDGHCRPLTSSTNERRFIARFTLFAPLSIALHRSRNRQIARACSGADPRFVLHVTATAFGHAMARTLAERLRAHE